MNRILYDVNKNLLGLHRISIRFALGFHGFQYDHNSLTPPIRYPRRQFTLNRIFCHDFNMTLNITLNMDFWSDYKCGPEIETKCALIWLQIWHNLFEASENSEFVLLLEFPKFAENLKFYSFSRIYSIPRKSRTCRFSRKSQISWTSNSAQRQFDSVWLSPQPLLRRPIQFGESSMKAYFSLHSAYIMTTPEKYRCTYLNEFV